MAKNISNKQSEHYLLELTNLPTAAGKEQRVIDWILNWASKRKSIKVKQDKSGNYLLTFSNSAVSKNPIIFAAHLDHPAFVITNADGSKVLADFRGGVDSAYFKGAKVRLHSADKKNAVGIVQSIKEANKTTQYKQAIIKFNKDANLQIGDILTWDLPDSKIKDGRLYAPVCDNLASVAAALSALEQLGKNKQKFDVRVLLTRSEEVGFIGAMAACKNKIIPKSSSVIVLENSRSFASSPIGAGPIIRVGDHTSTFDPQLTYAISQVAKSLTGDESLVVGGATGINKNSQSKFVFQRKLMPGGTCEATAYQAFGYKAACVCLPLGNYHNQNAKPQFPQSLEAKTEPVKIDSEFIGISDYHNLIELLAKIPEKLNDSKQKPNLKKRLDELFESRKNILD